ncbi:9404_t:CDS:2 [Ambispora gerdemannii]|uniref:9404_t:CDS:1 n=1 Tax=Ambispora gerdemannii TaxID=144530 RepID=A0A9N9AY88_9GLOM|nr:9404_t:CDS:2 [Ambispora gerdemannii]
MIEHFKSLIRHGKQATKHGRDNGRQPKTPQPLPERTHTNSRIYPEIAPKVDNATAVAQIVAEERDQKAKVPKYPGLQRFQILKKMGDGAFSNVYKALDTVTQKKVAIKVVRKYELNNSQATPYNNPLSFSERHLHRDVKNKPRAIERANILKEVQIMRQLKHPSIVSLVSFSEDKEYYYLVLELMEGGELFHQIVKLTYFSEPLSRHVIVQVAEGIHYLHEEKGVIHRDIKPENLLFDPIPIIPSKVPPPPPGPNDEPKEDEGEFISGVGGGGIGVVKIADFGLSKVVWNEQTMTPCGTVGYTAPEIVKDERYSKSVDMWALGCVLYTLLCGFPPFYDESIQILTEKVAKGHYTFLSPWWDDISASSKDLITHLLDVDPDKRYTIKEFFEHPWVKDEPFYPNVTTNASQNVETMSNETNIGGHQLPPLDFGSSATTPSVRLNRLLQPEVFSPGLASLKEAFEVSYAVHRMEEEVPRRKKVNINNDVPRENFLKNMITIIQNDDEDDEDELLTWSSSSTNQTKSEHSAVGPSYSHANEPVKMQTGNKNAVFPSAVKAKKNQARRIDFDLNLEGATLLGRRRKALQAVGY